MSKVSTRRGKRQRKRTGGGRRRATIIPPTTQAIVRVAPVPEKPWQIQGEELTILKNAVCKGASDAELQYCLTVAKRYKLDPFKKQIWFVPRWDASADNGHGGRGANVYTPQVGIDGLLFMSARDHAHDFGSVSAPEFGPMVQVSPTVKAPEWARVGVLKKGMTVPTVATVDWDEYAPDVEKKNQWGNYVAPFWRKMPKRMLGKCATALALRQAYPDLGGLYIPEECERMGEEHTESGRQIVSGVPTGGSHEAAQAVAQRKIAEAAAGKPIEPEIIAPSEPVLQDAPILTLDWTNEASPVVTGDVEALKPLFERYCTWEKDSFWHTQPRHAEAIREAAKVLKFKLTEIMPGKKVSRPFDGDSGKGGAQGEAGAAQTKAPLKDSRQAKRKETPSEGGAGATTSQTTNTGPQLVCGVIERVFVTLKGNKSMAMVTLLMPDGKHKREAGCWDKDIYQLLDKGKGLNCQVFMRTKGQYTDIVALQRIGDQEYTEGKVKVIQQRDREAGTRTLFGK